MCEKCNDLDYPVADIWRACWQPAKKHRGWIPTTLRGGFSDEDYSLQTKIDSLMAIIRTQRTEIAVLKLTVAQQDEVGEKFEGI